MTKFFPVLKNSSLALVAVLGLSAAAPAQAQDAKIAVVDMQQALETVEAGKKAKASLEQDIKNKKAALEKEEAALMKMNEELKKQAAVMNEAARQKKQAELQERFMKMQEQRARAQQELAEKERTLTEPIIVKLRSIVSELAKSKGYDMVIQKSEGTVLYVQDKYDLTKELVARYNKQNKG